MTLSEELAWRGFVGQTTYDDIKKIDEPGITFYWGVDPSADSMQIGNLAAAILALRFIKAGHKGIILAGSATGMAGGDPDGKDETRARIPLDTIDSNVKAIESQFKTIFAGEDIEIVNNYDWFRNINYIDFLRDVGWHFSMTQLLDRDFVQSRIGEGGKGINYAEFSYSLIQGYDFLHLYRERGATLQLCAVDQFGNSVSGMQMIRKLENSRADVFGMPLVINKTTGKKFGKSEGGAIWLSSEKTSPYKFYQFWLNVDDTGVIDYLKIYTFLDKEEIEEIATQHFAAPEQRIAQQRLAYEVTNFVHGPKVTDSIVGITKSLLGNDSDSSIEAILSDAEQIKILANEIPTAAKGQTVVAALCESGVTTSNGEALRLISQNAISINGEKIAQDQMIEAASLIKKGKNQFVLVF